MPADLKQVEDFLRVSGMSEEPCIVTVPQALYEKAVTMFGKDRVRLATNIANDTTYFVWCGNGRVLVMA